MTPCVFRNILMQAPSASGEYPVILFAVSVASAYVVTPGSVNCPADDPDHPLLWCFSSCYSANPNRSVALMPCCNAHFVPVKYCGRVHCVTGRPLPLDTDYQAAVEWMRVSGAAAVRARCLSVTRCVAAASHELVALSPEQALLVAVVWLRR